MKIEEKIDKYLKLTEKALNEIKINKSDKKNEDIAKDFLDLSRRYLSDAKYFKEKNDLLNALSAVCYSHAFLDAGARIKVFNVKNNQLFMVD